MLPNCVTITENLNQLKMSSQEETTRDSLSKNTEQKTHRHLKSFNIKLAAIILILCVSPILAEKHQHNQSRSNSIDRRKTSSTSSSSSSDSQLSDEDPTVIPQYSTCNSCKKHKELKERNIQFIQADILTRLGFQKPPNVTGKFIPDVPAHLLAKFEHNGMQSDEPSFKTGPSISEEVDDFHVKTEKIVTFAQQYPRLRHSWRDHDILYFTFSDNLLKNLVGSASLYVYVHGAERKPLPSFYIEVLKVYKSSDHPDTPGTKKVGWTKVQQPLGRGDWVKVDVTEVVSEWFKNPRENLGIIVSGSVNGKKVIVTDTQPAKGAKVPYIEVTPREAKRRTRRNVGLNCDVHMNEPLCCRYPMTVDFEELKYDFIIAPKRFETYYCSGECPYITMQKYAHTHLLTIASSNTITPCCTPRKLSSISMLYFNERMDVIMTSLPGMVVDRCGCGG